MRGLFLIAAAQTRDSGAITPYQLERIAARLRDMFDFVLIDCPAGVGRGFRAAAAASDNAAIVVTPDAIAIRDAERVMGLLEQREIRRPSLIVNRAAKEHLRKNAPLNPERISDTLSLSLLGIIPEDRSVARAASEGRPIALRRSPASTAYRAIARRMLGEELPYTVYGGPRWLKKRGFHIAVK
jgi:septum site-determining protein MinD